MRPIDQLGRDEVRGLSGLLFDLDDTLLDHGRLGEAAYSALFRLHEAGLGLVIVTGRPAGWGAVLARQWPVDGAVTENGAIAFYQDGATLRRLDPLSEAERRARRVRLAGVVAELRERFSELAPADDVEARISDFAFDIGERRHVPPDVVSRASDLARERGARVTLSSVHFHVSLDGDDKASGALRLLGAMAGLDPAVARARYAFIGDSQNDEACFAAFRTTIAVRNLSGKPTVMPRFITSAERGAGFAEAARVLVARRTGTGVGAAPALE